MGQPAKHRIRRHAGVEPVGPLVTAERDDLSVMIGSEIGTRVHGEQCESLALRALAPDAGHAEPTMILHGKKPFIEPFLGGIGGIGELVKAVCQDETAMQGEGPVSLRKL